MKLSYGDQLNQPQKQQKVNGAKLVITVNQGLMWSHVSSSGFRRVQTLTS